MSELQGVGKWSHTKRLAKLKQIHEWLEQEDRDPDDRRVRETLDLGVVILLEIFRGTGDPPLQTYEALLDSRSGRAWDMLGMRFLDTRVLVDRFKAAGQEEKLRLRSKMTARGMI